MNWLLPLFSLLSAMSVPRPVPLPDVLPPGHKSVEHLLVLEPDPELVGSRFVAWPTAGFGPSIAIEPGVPFAFSSKYGTSIYHLPSGETWPGDDAIDDAFKRQHSLGLPCAEVSSVSAWQPLARIESWFAVAAKGDGALHFTATRELRFDDAGNPVDGAALWPWLCSIVALGAGGLWLLCKRADPASAGMASA